jgi:hypothetical protein
MMARCYPTTVTVVVLMTTKREHGAGKVYQKMFCNLRYLSASLRLNSVHFLYDKYIRTMLALCFLLVVINCIGLGLVS